MSVLKDFSYNEDEDGELPPLLTGEEADLDHILSSVKTDGGSNIVSDDKVRRSNLQIGADNVRGRPKIPVTIITGYLGSGKSTLLEMIALKGSDRKIAVILNEFGQSSEIEKAMTIRNGSASYEEWLDLGNGCLCCSLQNVGVKAIENMIERSPVKIDNILLETSGIADPAPIAKMFWQDDSLNSSVYIDGIITVLDSEHILKCLDDKPPTHWHGDSVLVGDNLTIAHFQIAMADRIILNKYDKIEGKSSDIAALEERIRSINAEAPLFYTKYGEIALSKLLDIHAFDASSFFEASKMPTTHDPRMCTVAINFRPFENQQEYDRFVKDFLQVLLWKSFGASSEGQNVSSVADKEWEIQRTKALILIKSPLEAKVIQGVRDTYDVLPGTFLPEMVDCKLVLIGKYLDKNRIEKFLNSVLNINSYVL